MTTAGSTINYTYDVDGTRIGKTVNITIGTTKSTTEHKYYIQDGRIVAETRGNDKLEFIYDEKGEPFALIYNGAKYYYVTNLQGNVVRIINSSGVWVANYTYDAWGNVISSSGERIKDINPLRYRGYYYDTETGLYYLNSRYYDPVTCRFINADDTDVLTASMDNPNHDKNLFAYCDNNPVMRKDGGGEFWHILAGSIIGAAVSAVATIAVNVATGNGKKWYEGLGSSMVTGALSGGLAAAGLACGFQMVGNAVIGFVGNIGTSIFKGEKINWGSAFSDAAIGAIAGRIGGDGIGNNSGVRQMSSRFTSKLKEAGKTIVKGFKSGSSMVATIKTAAKTIAKGAKNYLRPIFKVFTKPPIFKNAFLKPTAFGAGCKYVYYTYK